MNLHEYENIVVESMPDDWTIFSCEGFGAGPSYLARLSVWTAKRDEFQGIEVESHSMRASLKSDLSVWFAWGFPCNPDFKEDWANKFPNRTASSHYVDFFYGSVLVFRDVYVSVDGGGCMLPLPEQETDPETFEVVRLSVPKRAERFYRLLNALRDSADFDRYFDSRVIELTDTPWMN